VRTAPAHARGTYGGNRVVPYDDIAAKRLLTCAVDHSCIAKMNITRGSLRSCLHRSSTVCWLAATVAPWRIHQRPIENGSAEDSDTVLRTRVTVSWADARLVPLAGNCLIS